MRTNDVSGSSSLLDALSSETANDGSSVSSYAFLKAIKMVPPTNGSLVVDSRHTVITLKVAFDKTSPAACDISHVISKLLGFVQIWTLLLLIILPQEESCAGFF